MTKNKDGTMPVLDHLAELRLRLVISAGALFIAAIVAFGYIIPIRAILTGQLQGAELIYLSPPEAFMANLRLAIISGIIISAPITLSQLAAFVFPGLNRGEKQLFVLTLLGMVLLFMTGVFFAYFVVFPFTLKFFLQFASEQVEPRFTISDYISFIFSFHLSFGLVFQLPLLTWALGKLGLLSTGFLRRHRKIALLIMLVVAAIITPPDIVSQVVMVLPLLLLYELGILMVLISERKRLRESL